MTIAVSHSEAHAQVTVGHSTAQISASNCQRVRTCFLFAAPHSASAAYRYFVNSPLS